MRVPSHPLAVALLRPPAVLFEGLTRLRNAYFDRPGNQRRAGLPVISVGNLTVGGTGKTPVVAWLAQRLLENDRRPAVVSRGYGGRAGAGPLLVSDGRGPRCPASVCGDEPHQLASTLHGVLVVVGSDRAAGAEAARRGGANVVVLDDGYQHRRLARDLDLLLLDSGNPFGNSRVLPAGPLREPLAQMHRADMILITRISGHERRPAIERIVRQHNAAAPLLYAGHRRVGFVDRHGSAALRPTRAVAFCGIGHPAQFREDLEREGIEIADFVAHADHHPYSPDEMQALRRLARDRDAVLVTTQKDLARISGMSGMDDRTAILALRIEAVIHEPAPLIEWILRVTRGDGEHGP